MNACATAVPPEYQFIAQQQSFSITTAVPPAALGLPCSTCLPGARQHGSAKGFLCSSWAASETRVVAISVP